MELKEIAENFISIMPLMQQKIIKPFENFGIKAISPIQFHVLIILQFSQHTMTELSGFLHISKQQLTPIIEKLYSRKLVERIDDLDDRRKTIIRLLPAGIELIENQKQEIIKMFIKRISILDSDDIISLNQAFISIKGILEKLV